VGSGRSASLDRGAPGLIAGIGFNFVPSDSNHSDRRAIFARRRRFLELSLIGVATTTCASDTVKIETPRHDALEQEPQPPVRGATPNPTTPSSPRPCLSVVPMQDREREWRERERDRLLELEREAESAGSTPSEPERSQDLE
jgi:hypothetical protein